MIRCLWKTVDICLYFCMNGDCKLSVSQITVCLYLQPRWFGKSSLNVCLTVHSGCAVYFREIITLHFNSYTPDFGVTYWANYMLEHLCLLCWFYYGVTFFLSTLLIWTNLSVLFQSCSLFNLFPLFKLIHK